MSMLEIKNRINVISKRNWCVDIGIRGTLVFLVISKQTSGIIRESLVSSGMPIFDGYTSQ